MPSYTVCRYCGGRGRSLYTNAKTKRRPTAQMRPCALLTWVEYTSAARLGAYDPKHPVLHICSLAPATKSFADGFSRITLPIRQVRPIRLHHRVPRAKPHLDMSWYATYLLANLFLTAISFFGSPEASRPLLTTRHPSLEPRARVARPGVSREVKFRYSALQKSQKHATNTPPGSVPNLF